MNGCAAPNVYARNSKLLELYDGLRSRYDDVISIIAILYQTDFSSLTLSDGELYSLLTVTTHIIIRYVSEKKREQLARGLELFKHVLPDQLLRTWYFAYDTLRDQRIEGVDLENWIQVCWLNNFTLNERMELEPIFMVDDNAVGRPQEREFICKLIYLEALHARPDLQRADMMVDMLPQYYEKLVIGTFELMNSINLRKFPHIADTLRKMTVMPRTPELKNKFAEVIPVHNNEDFDIDAGEIPATVM